MDIKDTWGVDSSPGTAQATDLKCGNLFASMGATGSATLPAYSTDIGDRATVTPGTHPTINTGPATLAAPGSPWTPTAASLARGASLGFSSRGTVLFDSFAMMYGLAEKATASGSVSISYWISPDGPAQGAILSSPFQSYHKVPNNNSSPTQRDFAVYLTFNPVCGAGIASAYAPDLPNGGAPIVIDGSLPSTGSLINTPDWKGVIILSMANTASWDYGTGFPYMPNAVISDPSYDRGSTGLYYHVMISMHVVSGRVKATIYVNDTAIATDAFISADFSTSITNEPCLFPFGPTTGNGGASFPRIADGAVQNVDPEIPGSNVWQIGGRQTDFGAEWGRGSNNLTVFPEGDGLYGAVTELWIAEGQYVDWSNSANRNKFHTTDILGNVFVPTDIGAHGETPTGTRPTMYFTGDPTKFVINRVNGATASVYKGTTNSLTLDGRYPGAL